MFLNYYLIVSLILDVVILTNIDLNEEINEDEEFEVILEEIEEWDNPISVFLYKLYSSVYNGNKVTVVMLIITISLIPLFRWCLIAIFIKYIRDK